MEFARDPSHPFLTPSNQEHLVAILGGSETEASRMITVAMRRSLKSTVPEMQSAVLKYNEYMSTTFSTSKSQVDASITAIAKGLHCTHPFVTLTNTKDALTVIVGSVERAQLLIARTAHYFIKGHCPERGTAFDSVPQDTLDGITDALTECRLNPLDSDTPPGFGQFFKGKWWMTDSQLRTNVFKASGQRRQWCFDDFKMLREAIHRDPWHPLLALDQMSALRLIFPGGGKSSATQLMNRKAKLILDKLGVKCPSGAYLECAKAKANDLKALDGLYTKATPDSLELLTWVLGETTANRMIHFV